MIANDRSTRRIAFSRGQTARAFLIGVCFTLAFTVVFAFRAVPEPLRFEPGQVSVKTILAPDRVTFASEIQTSDARAKAESDVKDVYDPPDADLARERVRFASAVFNYMDVVRRDPYSTFERKSEWVRAIPTITVPSLTINRTLLLDENAFQRTQAETVYVLDVTMRNTIRPSDLPAEMARIPSRVTLALPADQAALVAQWVQALVTPNSKFNSVKTEEQRAQARRQVSAVYRTIEKGQAIVREGEIVTPLAIEALESAGFLRPRPSIADYAGPALYALLLAVLLAIYLIRIRPIIFLRPGNLLLIAFLILFFSIGAKWLVDVQPLAIYLLPIAAGAMLVAVLIDTPVAIGVSLILALTAGYFAHSSLELTFFALAGSVVAALSLEHIERLPGFFWSSLYVAVTNIASVAVFRLLTLETDWETWSFLLAAAVGNGALAGLIALGSLFVLGKSFGIMTSIELLDLARPTHPLLKKLLVEAPGTYHHSLIVSQLAEQAAQQIGADSLLVRVAAYYHDVGKTRDPQSFVENQLDGINIHDTLDPKTSAAIVIDHVSRGILLGHKYHLPERLLEFIPQHHGTTLTAYFHRKALKANGNSSVDKKDYRYPGPKPQTREAAILMLADGVEATMRAEHPITPEQIRSIIDRSINDRLQDKQLDESDLTLRDIQDIKDAFFGVLQGLYHPRVKYPEPPPAQFPEQIHEH